METYLRLGDPVRADPASAAAVSQIDQSIAELSRKVRERADEALATPDLAVGDAIDAVKLFVPIALKDDGLQLLSDHLRSSIKRESDEDVRALLLEKGDTAGEEPHIVALARLFESVAGVLYDAQPRVIELFGGLSLCTLVGSLQKQCDASAERILDRYEEKLGIEDVRRALKSETANARDLDAPLDQVTLLSQRMAAYFAFVQVRGDISTLSEDDNKTLKVLLNAVLEDSALAKRRKQLAGHYSVMEAYFVRENAKLAIKIDESNGEDAETSTAVDDFFFVMQKCFQRSFSFGDTDPDVLRLALQQISQCLMDDLLSYMRRRLRETEAATEKLFRTSPSTSALPAAAATVSYLTELAKANISIPGGTEEQTQQSDVAKYDFFIALNNAAVSADYASRLRSNAEKAIQASPKLSVDDRALLAAPIAQMTDASRAMTLAAEHGVSRLASVLINRVSAAVEASLREASYIVTEAQYSLDSDATPSFSREVAHEIEMKVLNTSLEKRLTEKNWDALVRQVAEWYAQKVESIIFLPIPSGNTAKPFNAFGGLRADRDVRAISAYFSGKSRRSTVRDVFGRLSQLAMLVNLERPAEIYDIWGPNAGGMTWRLSATEVRRSLALRTDFNQDAVRSLKL